MEGYKGIPPSGITPFFWSPGWNSVQSVTKFQNEPGGALKDGDPGVILFKEKPGAGQSSLKIYRKHLLRVSKNGWCFRNMMYWVQEN